MPATIDFLIRRRDLEVIGTPDSSVRRALRRGSLVRVAAGSYADLDVWNELEPIDRHRARVMAVAGRLRTAPVFSHFAAAALWGIRILGPWPTVVDVTLERASGGRSDGALRRHCTGLDGIEVLELDGLALTSPAQTAVDLARELPFADAVVALDSALHRRRRPTPLATEDQIARVVAATEGNRGYRRALASSGFATSLSDSVEESHSRVQLHLLGFPEPELQRRFALANSRHAEVDFYWPDFDHIGECDGRMKYRDPRILQGRTRDQVFFAEKGRENELRQQVRMFSRWEPRELYPPQQLYDRLVRDGLPSSKPRPAPRWRT
ncbi:hypothetical protein [Leifsonella bigeumensis]